VGIKYLLDSVILIDHLNGVHEATEYIKRFHKDCAVSVITRAEVLVPYEWEAAQPILRLLDSFQTLTIEPVIADRAASLRREHRWKLPDAFQAAIAETHSLKFVTRNTRDFPLAKYQFVIEPYTIRQ